MIPVITKAYLNPTVDYKTDAKIGPRIEPRPNAPVLIEAMMFLS